MLVIRQAQMRVLEDVQLVRFIGDALARALPREAVALGDLALAELAVKALKSGRAFGLTSADDLLRWALITLRLGVDFQTDLAHAWIHEFLDDWDPDRGARVVRLEKALLDRVASQERTTE